MSSTTNNPFSNDLVLTLISNLQGESLLNMMNSFEQINHLVESNMSFIIQQFITQRPYEQTLWEFYNPITIEQFKTNLKVQEFVISNQFEQVMERINFQSSVEEGKPNKYGNEINSTRKLLFGMIYYHQTYLGGEGNLSLFDRLSMIIYLFDKHSNDCIKFFIKVITFYPSIGDLEESEQDITFFHEKGTHVQFFEYLEEMYTIADLDDILLTFTCFKPIALQFFKTHCKSGIKSKDAREFVDRNINMTPKRKIIYFALVDHMESDDIYDIIKNNVSDDILN